MAENIEKCVFMFKQACAFAECGKHCEIEPLPFNMRKSNFRIAGMVNSAFACEILLKTILQYYKIDYDKIRTLDKLWEKLQGGSKKIADEISATVDSIYLTAQPNIIERILKVQSISETFLQWRYIYEEPPLDSATILKLKQKRSNGIELNDEEKEQSGRFSNDPNFIRFFRDVLKAKCCEILYDCSCDEYINR